MVHALSLPESTNRNLLLCVAREAIRKLRRRARGGPAPYSKFICLLRPSALES